MDELNIQLERIFMDNKFSRVNDALNGSRMNNLTSSWSLGRRMIGIIELELSIEKPKD